MAIIAPFIENGTQIWKIVHPKGEEPDIENFVPHWDSAPER